MDAPRLAGLGLMLAAVLGVGLVALPIVGSAYRMARLERVLHQPELIFHAGWMPWLILFVLAGLLAGGLAMLALPKRTRDA